MRRKKAGVPGESRTRNKRHFKCRASAVGLQEQNGGAGRSRTYNNPLLRRNPLPSWDTAP